MKSIIFLSYSSRDRLAVERLARDLRKRNLSVWLDEWEIEVGDNILTQLEKGLSRAKFVGVWLTKHSAASEWVRHEWQSAIFQEIAKRQILVLPLLAEDCEIPVFLAGKKYADFRGSYSHGLEELIRSVRVRRSRPREEGAPAEDFSIMTSTVKFLNDLEEAQIPLPTLGNLKLVRALKALPRSGKLLRLESMRPTIPIRSVYDHILSVAHSADQLLPVLEDNLEELNRLDLARTIAYHDLCEAILGDIPQYTRLNRAKRNRARVSAEYLLSSLPNGEPERITNEFIALFLQESERSSLKHVQTILAGRSVTRRVFYALDKLDPIVAIWRYINVFRTDKHFRIDDFLQRTAHFFENPGVRSAVTKNLSDVRMTELVAKLQNPAGARQYFFEAELLEDQIFHFPPDLVKQLIEGRDLQFVLPRGRRTNRGSGRARPTENPPSQEASPGSRLQA